MCSKDKFMNAVLARGVSDGVNQDKQINPDAAISKINSAIEAACLKGRYDAKVNVLYRKNPFRTWTHSEIEYILLLVNHYDEKGYHVRYKYNFSDTFSIGFSFTLVLSWRG